MKILMKKNLCVAKKFNDTIRYIDDLLTVNNSKFEKEICNIYPPELTLKRTSESERNVSYLDISISICGGKYVTEVYDKRDDFNFDIVNFPYMCSNIPAKSTYGVYISQLIRICRICDNKSILVFFQDINCLLRDQLDRDSGIINYVLLLRNLQEGTMY